MLKYLRYYYLNKIVKDPHLAAKIYEMIYHQVKFDGTPTLYNSTVHVANISTIKEPSEKSEPIDSKLLERKELEKTLIYLKAKPIKTKQEKDSIGIIEAVLKNER
jgi:hypothetical protein